MIIRASAGIVTAAIMSVACGATVGAADPTPVQVISAVSGSLTDGDYTSASGDVWMGARWYRPGTAGFLNRDTVFGYQTSPASLNRYTYGWGNPLTMWDPDGRDPCSWCDSTDTAIQSVLQQLGDPTKSVTVPRDLLFPQPQPRQLPSAEATEDAWCQQQNGCFSFANFETNPDGFAYGTSGGAALDRTAQGFKTAGVIVFTTIAQMNPVISGYMAVRGIDPFTGEHLSTGERIIQGVFVALDVVPFVVEAAFTVKAAAVSAREVKAAAALGDVVSTVGAEARAGTRVGHTVASLDEFATTTSDLLNSTSAIAKSETELSALSTLAKSDAIPGVATNNVIVDTNAVYNRPGTLGALQPGETPVMTRATVGELANNAASGRMKPLVSRTSWASSTTSWM